MKKKLIIAISAVQFLVIQPSFAQMMKKDMMQDNQKQEQMMKKDMTQDNCNQEQMMQNRNMDKMGNMQENMRVGYMRRMRGMNMGGMMNSGRHKGIMGLYIFSAIINTVLKWTLMLFGIIALQKWIKKQK